MAGRKRTRRTSCDGSFQVPVCRCSSRPRLTGDGRPHVDGAGGWCKRRGGRSAASPLVARELAVQAVRLGEVGAEALHAVLLVVLEVALEPVPRAGVLVVPSTQGCACQMRSSEPAKSWLVGVAQQPGNSRSASSGSPASPCRGRWWARPATRGFAACLRVSARLSLLRSPPPLSTPALLLVGARRVDALACARLRDLLLADGDVVVAALDLPPSSVESSPRGSSHVGKLPVSPSSSEPEVTGSVPRSS